MRTSFAIKEAGSIGNTSLLFLKGVLKEGVLEERFKGVVDLGTRSVEVEVQGKSLVPISTDPQLKTYVLKVAEPDGFDLESLVGKVLVFES